MFAYNSDIKCFSFINNENTLGIVQTAITSQIPQIIRKYFKHVSSKLPESSKDTFLTKNVGFPLK